MTRVSKLCSIKTLPSFRTPVLLFFLFLVSARAAWVEKENQSEPSLVPGVVHHHIVLEDTASAEVAVLDLALFSPNASRLRLIGNPDGEQRLAGVLSQGDYLAGSNGGYFDTGFAPLGLRIENSKIISPLVRGKLMTGVLAAWPGRVKIFRVSEFSTKLKPTVAIQCGPFLVDHGRPVKGLEANRAARRTFVATGAGDRAALGSCSEISLAGLGEILAGSPGHFRIDRALNLDGGSSTAFWFRPREGNTFSIREQKPVRDFLAIESK
jgi:Phosphodiester glycosidase